MGSGLEKKIAWTEVSGPVCKPPPDACASRARGAGEARTEPTSRLACACTGRGAVSVECVTEVATRAVPRAFEHEVTQTRVAG